MTRAGIESSGAAAPTHLEAIPTDRITSQGDKDGDDHNELQEDSCSGGAERAGGQHTPFAGGKRGGGLRKRARGRTYRTIVLRRRYLSFPELCLLKRCTARQLS